MDSELLSLKWNNHNASFFSMLSTIRSKELFSDVTIACDGKFYSAHKFVLSNCSEYFAQMFHLTQKQMHHPIVILKDIKHSDFEYILDFMYVGEVNVQHPELSSLINAAECLQIKGLAVQDNSEQYHVAKDNLKRPARQMHNTPSKKRKQNSSSTSETSLQSDVKHKTSNSVNSSDNFKSLVNLRNTSTRTSVKSRSCNDIQNNVSAECQNTSDEEHIHTENSDHFAEENFLPTDESPKELSDADIKEEIEESVNNSIKGAHEIPENLAVLSQNCNFMKHNDEHEEKFNRMDFESCADKQMDTCMDLQENATSGMALSQSATRDPAYSDPPPVDGTSENLEAQFQMWNQSPPFTLQEPDSAYQAPAAANSVQYHGGYASSNSTEEQQQPQNQDGQTDNSGPPATVGIATFHTIGGEGCNALKQCSLCPYTTVRLSNIKNHLQRHLGEKPYACPYCTFRCTHKPYLKVHLRVHTGEKPYQCPYCDYKAAQKSHVKVHVITNHEGAEFN